MTQHPPPVFASFHGFSTFPVRPVRKVRWFDYKFYKLFSAFFGVFKPSKTCNCVSSAFTSFFTFSIALPQTLFSACLGTWSFLRPWKNWSTHVSVVFNERLWGRLLRHRCATVLPIHNKMSSKLVFLKGSVAVSTELPTSPSAWYGMHAINKQHHQNKTAQEA